MSGKAREQQQLAAWREMQEILRRVLTRAEYFELMDALWTPDPVSAPRI